MPEAAGEAKASASLDHCSCRLLEEAVSRLRPTADTALGFAELLESRGCGGSEGQRREDLEALLAHCRSMSTLLRDIGDLLRIGNGALQLLEQQIDAADLAEVAMKRCAAAAARHDATLTADLTEGIEIQGDPARLRQALEAIVLHAMHAAPGAALRFMLKRATGGALAFALLSPAIPPPPESTRKLLCAPLDQLGLDGVGLAVARRIALRHGGDVTIAPGPGGGTAFCLILPGPRVTWPQDAVRTGFRAA